VETPLYTMRGLTHVYRGKTVLSIDRLDLPRGGIVGVIGPNGSGKSTFLRLAGFVERPTAGEVLFDGKPASPFSPEVRNRVTLLPQEPFLMKRTVLNNVAYGLRIRKASDHLSERVDKALSYVGLDGKDFAQRPSYALSGGEAQRVALAARLILKPEVLLMDEPTASIDALSAQLIKDAVLKARRDWGTTLIVASHDWQWLYGICDTVFHLLKGRFLGTGRENILFGPWERVENGRWGKRLADGQQLLVPKPPEALAAAVVENVTIMPQAEPVSGAAGQVTLSGLITRLALEKASGSIVVSVLVANLPFTATLTEHQVRDHELYPGRMVTIRYNLNSVKWV
jgi:tungstate transport system ATP-binding protein